MTLSILSTRAIPAKSGAGAGLVPLRMRAYSVRTASPIRRDDLGVGYCSGSVVSRNKKTAGANPKYVELEFRAKARLFHFD